MKTSELQGALLDYWTARAEGVPADQLEIRATGTLCVRNTPGTNWDGTVITPLDYSTNWALAGPLVEKYKLDLDFDSKRGWSAATEDVVHWMHADDARTAICRTVVEAAFGDEVEDLPCA